MAVTELALLRLSNEAALHDEMFRSRLIRAKQEMERFTAQKFCYLVQIENPSLLYIVGNWTSVKQHHEEWIPSETNQRLLELLKHDLNVEHLCHVNLDPNTIATDATVLAIERYVVRREKKAKFTKYINAVKSKLESFDRPRRITGGWKIEERLDDSEEFFLFSGWDDVALHEKFKNRSSFEERDELADLLDKREDRHARLLRL